MDILEALKGVELNEEQEQTLVAFLQTFAEEIKTKALENSSSINEDEIVKRERAIFEEEKTQLIAENKKAFELFEEKVRDAFSNYTEDTKNAFEDFKSDMQAEYTENMAKALQDVFEEVEARAKKDIYESEEFKALSQIKKLVAPMLIESDKKDLLEEIEVLRKEQKALLEEKEKSEKAKIIATLLEDFPEEYKETVKTFCESATTIDEVYDRFSVVVEMIQADASVANINEACDSKKRRFAKKSKAKPKVDEPNDVEPIDESVQNDIDENATDLDENANPMFESTSVNSNTENKKKNYDASKYFSDAERKYLSNIFGYVNQ